MFRAVERAIIMFSKLCFVAASASLFVIAAYGAGDMVSAMIFGGGLPVTREASSVLLAAAIFLSFGYSQHKRQDIRVDVLIERCSGAVQRTSAFVSLVLGICVFALLTWQSWELFIRSWRVGETAVALIPFPIYPAKFTLVLGSLAATLELLRQLVNFLRARTTEVASSPEAYH